jgi:hypothetical protein
MQSRVLLAILTLLVGSCTRYEWQNELDVRGLCAPRAVPRFRISHREEADLTDAKLSLRGRVTDAAVGNPLAEARVRLVAAVEQRDVATDSAGRFQLDSLAADRYVMDVLRVGYHQATDTLEVASGRRLIVDVALDQAILDGPCSGFAAVRVRKPWWKFW